MPITGENVAFLIYRDGGWRHYGCALSCSLTVSTSTIETSTTGSGDYATFIPQKHSGSGSITGITGIDLTSTLTLADLRALQLSKTKLQVRIERTDGADTYTDAFFCYITNSTDTGELNSVASFSIDFVTTGTISQLFTPTLLTHSNMNRTDGSAAGGELTINIPALIDTELIEFVLNGLGLVVITTGTPATNEVLFDSATGDLTFSTALAINDYYYAIYQTT